MKKFARLMLVVLLFCLTFIHTGCLEGSQKRAVNESERDIPVAYDVDVVVVGGTSGGVAAAVEAARNGATVFLAAQRPYLGADICGTYRLWLEPGEVVTTGVEASSGTDTTPATDDGGTVPTDGIMRMIGG